ncbi:MAG: aminopeptidase P family protein [Clostridia bacterium]|nr:aminopeptidase P family protein [Clostridia bacterium]
MKEHYISLINRLYSKCDCDALVISAPSDTLYLTGYTSDDITIVIADDKRYIYTDKRYTTELTSLLGDIYEIIDGNNDDIFKLLCGKSRIGIDEDISYVAFCSLIGSFDGYSYDNLDSRRALIPIHKVIADMRAVKSDCEVEAIIRSQAITDKAFSYILPYIKRGVTEIEIAARLDYFINSSGARTAFDTIVAFGENTACPHAHPTFRELSDGEFITMDFGAKLNGYCSDMTRTVALGNIDAQMRRVYDSVLKANIIGIDALREGITGRDADKAARDYLTAVGLGEYFTHSLGHSVGIDIHEEPVLSPRYSAPLPAGTVITVEPGVYIAGKFGVRIEDMLKITEDGAYNLTKSSKSLIIIDGN